MLQTEQKDLGYVYVKRRIDKICGITNTVTSVLTTGWTTSFLGLVDLALGDRRRQFRAVRMEL